MKNQIKKEYVIILIDDDEDDQEIFSEALKVAKPELKFCSIRNDSELYAFFESKTVPYMFFLDWSFQCNFENKCLELIKQQQHLRIVPVIIYSGLNAPNEISDQYEKGATLFINKPPSHHELTKILKILVNLNWDQFNLQDAKKRLMGKIAAIKFPENIRF